MNGTHAARDGQPSVVTLRTQSQLHALTGAGCSAAVASARFEVHDGEVSSLVVSGIAAGTATVHVTIHRAGVPAQDLVVDATAHVWTAAFDLAPPAGVGSIVRIDTAAADCDATDAVVLSLVPTARYPATEGIPAGFEADRVPAIAGHPDRVVRSRCYAPLYLSGIFNYPALLDIVNVDILDFNVFTTIYGSSAPRASLAFTLDASRFRGQAEQILRGFEERAARANGVVSLLEVQRALADLADSALTERERSEATGRESGGIDLSLRTAPLRQVRRAGADLQFLAFDAQANEIVAELRLPRGEVQARTVARQMLAVAIPFGMAEILRTAWLGVLFYDELHYRPVGKVIGEIVYELSLAPGEEVHLAQHTASTRTVSLEDIRDREMERNLQFASSWTQNVSQAEAWATSASIGGNLGGNATIPQTPAGVHAGVTAQGAAETSSQLQIQRAYETSRQLATTMRERHTVTLDISSEETTDFTSKRTIRNPNQLRALTLDYRKVYRKDRVLLQRHDAKLCLCLRVEDPGHRSRQSFLDALWQVNPDNPELYACATSGQPFHAEDTFDRTLTNQFQTPVMPGLLDAHAGFGEVTINIQPSSTESDLLLAGTPTVEVTRFVIRDFWTNGLNELLPAEYAVRGGQVSWREPRPRKLGAPGEYRLKVGFPRSQAALNMYATESVRVRVTARWMREPAATADYWACVEGEQRRLREEFTASAVFEIAERLRRSSHDSVLSKLVATGFPYLDNPFVSQGPESLRALFEWNEVQVEHLPWWLTASGTDNYESLRQAIGQLPLALDPDRLIEDFLVASEAFVYLPIRPGSEEQALALVRGELDQKFEVLVQDFRAYRDAHYGPTGHPVPDHASVSAPGPSIGTPSGAEDWATNWERPDFKFDVLAEWSEIFPTDGVACEPSLSTGTATDELRTQQLRTVDPA